MAALVSSDADLDVLYIVNVLGTEHVLKAVCQADLDPVIVIPGSSAVYGLVRPDDLPIRESQPFRPSNPYAVSKIAQEMLAYTYYARYGLKVIRTRAFNLVGPGQPSSLVGSAFAQQIARIEAGYAEPVLRVGNLAAQRDFVDVRDAVGAYWLAAQRGQPGDVYNICSGLGVSIRTCLDELLMLTEEPIEVVQDPTRVRPSDIPVSVGDGSLLRKQTGWRPMIPLERSLADLLEEWRGRVQEA
jgi:GDP-4-dehydro-6-deoxy-D-mannose reductase